MMGLIFGTVVFFTVIIFVVMGVPFYHFIKEDQKYTDAQNNKT